MAKKQAEDEDELIYFRVEQTLGKPFPIHALCIVDAENKRVTILDAKKMDVWAEIPVTMPPSSNG